MTEDITLQQGLKAAADFFDAHPDKRTHGVLARDSMGFEVSPRSPRAACWCALGRLAKELDNEPEPECYYGTGALVGLFPSTLRSEADDLWVFNDSHRAPDLTPRITKRMRYLAEQLENHTDA